MPALAAGGTPGGSILVPIASPVLDRCPPAPRGMLHLRRRMPDGLHDGLHDGLQTVAAAFSPRCGVSMQQISDPYEAIAEWYDVEHDALSEDVECYLELLAMLPSAGNGPLRVLEFGSGTGRITAKLAAAGHHVTGVEPSRAMRERSHARLAGLPERVRRRIAIVAGSATEPGLTTAEPFDAVLFGLNTLAHLTQVEERRAAMRSASARLRAGGQILLDVDLLGPRRLAEHFGQLWWQGSWRLADSPAVLTHVLCALPSEQPDAIEVQHLYDVFEPGGGVRRTLATMAIALLTYSDVVGAATGAGFSVAGVYGGHDLAPLDHDSPRLIVDARLAGA
jgi:SAM-dependent methyltransferase